MNRLPILLKGILGYFNEVKYTSRRSTEIKCYNVLDVREDERLTKLTGIPVFLSITLLKKVLDSNNQCFSEAYLDDVLLTEAAMSLANDKNEKAIVVSENIVNMPDDEIFALLLEARLLGEYSEAKSELSFIDLHKEVDKKIVSAGYGNAMRNIVKRLVHRHHTNKSFLNSLDYMKRLKNFN
jgi:hypothetical protein